MFRWLRLLSSRASKASRGSPSRNALSALQAGDFAAAEPMLTREIEDASRPQQRAFYLNKRGVTRIKLGRREDARADFQSALECVARYAPALTNVGSLLLEDGRVDEAITAYCEAIDADPEYAVAYVNLGSAYKRAGRLDEAIRAMRTGLRLEGRKRARPRERL